MVQLAILEKNIEFSRKLLNFIVSHNKNVHLINISVNTEEIIEVLDLLNEKDILLLDLSIPEMNTNKLISILNEKRKQMPYIIGITNDMKQCEQLKDYVYDIIKKTCSFSKIIDTINEITNISDERYYEKLIKEELSKFEINITTLGYDYIVKGIMLSLRNKTLLKNLQNGLYKTLATESNISNNYNVKWAVEKCIKSTIRYTNYDITKRYFHVEMAQSVTPKLFISMIVYNLKNKIQ